MRVDELEQALRVAADGQPPVTDVLETVREGGRRRQRIRSLSLSVVGVGVVVAIGASLFAWTRSQDDHEVSTGPVASASGEWEALPDPPLSPRSQVVGVWTGSEVLFVGGNTWLCPPGADCVAPTDPGTERRSHPRSGR